MRWKVAVPEGHERRVTVLKAIVEFALLEEGSRNDFEQFLVVPVPEVSVRFARDTSRRPPELASRYW